MGRKVPFPQSKEEAGVLRRELAVRAYSPRPEPPVLRVGATAHFPTCRFAAQTIHELFQDDLDFLRRRLLTP